MKSYWLSKNRRGSRAAPRLSLFPFLAVLICTMGALMLLLLFVTRQVRLQVARDAAAKIAEKQSSIAAEMEMVQWRIDQLKSSRKETAAQLTDTRLVLGHIEDHGRRLRTQFQELTEQAKKAAAEGLKPGRFAAPGVEELRQIEAQIAEAQQRLAQSQQTATSRPKSYAIVPYDGPNHTRRRPIYIECRSDAVVLQPENIAFDEADFDEPLGPGNPLAAAVRAAREQMLLQHSIDPQDQGEPYPLLLVRPDGIAAYDAALSAMKSWGSEFGYEMINAEWQLKFPPPDQNVSRAVAQAVTLARQEHARLIAAAPSKYGKRPRPGAYRSSLAGGDGGGGGGGGEQGRAGDGASPGFYSSKPADRYGQRYAGGGSGAGTSAGASGGLGSSGSPVRSGGKSFGGGGGTGSDEGHEGGSGSADEEFAANNPYQALPLPGGSGSGTGSGIPGGAGPGSGGGGPAGLNGGAYGGSAASGNIAGNGLGGSPAGGTGSGACGAGNPGSGGAASGGGSPGMASGSVANVYTPSAGQPGVASSGQTGSGQSGAQANGQAANQDNGQSLNQSNGQPTGSAAAAGVARPDGYITGRPNDGNPNPQPPRRPDPSSAVAMVPETPLRPGEWRPSAEPPPKPDPEDEKKKKKKKHPYDDMQPDHNQADWALRNARSHAAAISRPVHIDCYADRVVIAPEQPGGEPHVIVCDNDSQRNADKLVAAIWEVMDTWGMAGREMYWRPVLNFYVTPGAEPRMFEMTRALDGSGLVIERKQ
jgi:hypothetical protein